MSKETSRAKAMLVVLVLMVVVMVAMSGKGVGRGGAYSIKLLVSMSEGDVHTAIKRILSKRGERGRNITHEIILLDTSRLSFVSISYGDAKKNGKL